MLSKREKYMMSYLYQQCEGKGACLIRHDELWDYMRKKFSISEDAMFSLLKCLEMDDYLDVVSTERQEEKFYCVTLHGKGVGYQRELTQSKRQMWFRVAMSVMTAIFGFLITKILFLVFS